MHLKLESLTLDCGTLAAAPCFAAALPDTFLFMAFWVRLLLFSNWDCQDDRIREVAMPVRGKGHTKRECHTVTFLLAICTRCQSKHSS